MIYTRPDSYVERIKNASTQSDLPSTSIGGIIGIAPRGKANTPVRITSWSQYTSQFAQGISDPFSKGKLSNAVHGFFNNGGSVLYVVRALEKGVKATASVPTEGGVTFVAKDEGTWGNGLIVEIKADALVSSHFTMIVTLDGIKVEEIKKLTQETFIDVINATSKFVDVEEGEVTLEVGTGSLSEGVEELPTSATFTNCLDKFDRVLDLNMLAITGETHLGTQEALVDYCDLRGDVFPIVDAPLKATIEEVQAFKDKLSSYLGGLYYPSILVANPYTGKTQNIAPSGHIMGMIARTDAEVGVHKAPAGVDATLKGAIGVATELTPTEIGILNDYEVNCVTPRSGSGITVWGARMLRTDGDRQFVSDIRLDMFIDRALKQTTEWAVFEPKDDKLFNALESQVTGLMTNLWNEGKLLGSAPEEAFFVKCDSELNPDVMSSELYLEVGYAKKKPAEFIINRVSHKQI